MSRRRACTTVAIAIVLLTTACSEKKAAEPARTTTTGSDLECTGASVLSCIPKETTFYDLFPKKPVAATGDPIKIGMINNSTGPTVAFPELVQGTQAGIDWINKELGGVDGRPIEFLPCDVKFAATGSQSCGQQMVEQKVVAVLGGIDLFDDGVKVLEENKIPYVGGIPVSFASVESPISFQFSGGSWGQNLGLVWHMVKVQHAKKVSIVYSDFGSVTDGAKWARQGLITLGVAPENIKMVPMPIIVADMLAPLTTANDNNPDAMLVLVADAGCLPAYQGVHQLAIKAQTYWSAGCLLPSMTDAAGPANLEGFIYGLENPVRGNPPDVSTFSEVAEKYGAKSLTPQSAALVAMRSLMNLWAEMKEVGGADVTPDTIIAHLRKAVDHPGFAGHSYTCDGKQMAGELPAICSPQQIVAEFHDGAIRQLGDWIDVGKFASPPR